MAEGEKTLEETVQRILELSDDNKQTYISNLRRDKNPLEIDLLFHIPMFRDHIQGAFLKEYQDYVLFETKIKQQLKRSQEKNQEKKVLEHYSKDKLLYDVDYLVPNIVHDFKTYYDGIFKNTSKELDIKKKIFKNNILKKMYELSELKDDHDEWLQKLRKYRVSHILKNFKENGLDENFVQFITQENTRYFQPKLKSR
jgi:hypothetical protein